MSPMIAKLLWTATLETLEMVVCSTAVSVAVGLPLALFLVSGGRAKLYKIPFLPQITSIVIDGVRAVPFIILLVLLIPVTRMIAGTSLGTTAALVPLSIAGIPYFARLAEIALGEVDFNLIDAVRAMGGSRLRILYSVIIPEALPALIGQITVTLITMVSASAMAGVIGAGGLGDLAIRYGYQRFNTQIMLWVVVILIVLVSLIQFLGDRLTAYLRR